MLTAEIIFVNGESLVVKKDDAITIFSRYTDEPSGKSVPAQDQIDLTGNPLSGLADEIMNAIIGFEYFQLHSKDDTIYRTSAIVKIRNIYS